jgi:ribose transport system substrate-binding protein
VACVLALLPAACHTKRQVKIAVIPRTEGVALWDAGHSGAELAASRTGIFVHWTAPMREDDVESQIELVESVVSSGYQGLVLAPDQALSLITPVRRVLARGIPTVIIGSPMPIPAGGDLFYVLNDDVEGGRMAARRVAGLLNGHGTVAMLGINPDVTGIMIRARSFEEYLAQHDPGIQIVDRRLGTFDSSHEQQVAQDTLRSNPDLDLVVAFMWSSVEGTEQVLDTTHPNRSIKIVGFDSSGIPILGQNAGVDSIIQTDTRSICQHAVELIHAKLQGQSPPGTLYVQPKLITHENVNTPEIQTLLSSDFKLGQWQWSTIQ